MNKPSILVVEDDVPVRCLITTTLKTHGYKYLTASNGETAIMMTTSHNPDIMLLDLGLPDIDGIEVIRSVRTWSNLPIIVLSARSEDSDKIEALDNGADDYLTKPFSVDELLARLRVTQRRLNLLASDGINSPVFVNGPLKIDFSAGCVWLVCGRPMLGWVMRSVQQHITERPIVVLGFDGESVKDYFGKDCTYAYQQNVPGNRVDALRAGMSAVNADTGYVLVMAGNMPLVTERTVAALVEAAKGFSASRLICFSDDEDTLISPAYCFEISVLRECLKMDASDIESYVSCLRKKNMAVVDVYAPYIEGMEIADREDLWCCNAILRREINASLMRKGVTFIDPESAYIDADVRIGMDTVIYPDVYMSGRTVIGEGCRIYNGCRFDNTVVGDNCDMQAVVAIDAVVDDGARVGPYVRLRPNTHIGKNCKIGNFVEIKNSTIGEKTSVAHLTYVGDSDVGSHVNMGCGTVFVNYDGFEKHRCKVGDNVFLGCQTALVAPVTVGDDVYTAAGSVITEDIPAGTLAIARTRQENKEGWVAKYRAIKKKEK